MHYPEGYTPPIIIDEGTLITGLETVGINRIPRIHFKPFNNRLPYTLGLTFPLSDSLTIYTDPIIRKIQEDIETRGEQLPKPTEEHEVITPSKIMLGLLMIAPYLAEWVYNKVIKPPEFEESEIYQDAVKKGDFEQALLSYTSYVLTHEIAHKSLFEQRVLQASSLMITSGMIITSLATISISMLSLINGTQTELDSALLNRITFTSLTFVWVCRFLQELQANKFAYENFNIIQDAVSINPSLNT